MARVSCYVDGFNLYHAISELGRDDLKWVNLRRVAQSICRQDDELVGVSYFTAVQTFDKEKSARHCEYIKAIEASGVDVILSRFQSTPKWCFRYERSCIFREEKQSDVAFAMQVLDDAVSKVCERQILITADADHIPLVRRVRTRYTHISIEVWAPPGRLSRARELGALASWHDELTPSRLAACLLPRNVTNEYGHIVARCPAKYLSH
jgi:uncharacterized LabA/DUF88 family protein